MKLVALAAEPSVAAALNMMDEWEVFYTSEPDDVTREIPGASVVLIGGGTEGGLELAEYVRSLGVTIPIVVIGDTEAPPGARYPVVTRPFTLDELHYAIDGAVTGAKQSVPATPVQALSADASPQHDDSTTRIRHLEVARDPSEVVTLPTREPDLVHETPPVVTPSAAVLAPSTPAVAAAKVVEAPQEDPAPSSPEAPHSFRRRQEAIGRGLLRRRAKEDSGPVEDPMTAALREAFGSVASIEQAVDQLPVLTDLAELTQALLREVTDLLWPQTAAIYLPGPGGFRVWASHGFSNGEKTMVVQSHQPLFADLLVRHESVLIEPLDLAQQLAGGVGGARTGAFLATPIEVDKKCVGVIVAGREHFENEDLDHLAALANEAALGLGVALGLDRLRAKLT